MKNAITVIDQELIEYFDLVLSRCKGKAFADAATVKIEELLYMAIDLVEIKAELTKREQKYKLEHNMLVKNFENAVDNLSKMLSLALQNDSGLKLYSGMIDLHQVRCRNEIMKNFDSFNAIPILKGDSDE